MPIPSRSHQADVTRALDAALRNAGPGRVPFDIDKDRMIVFSDHHRGVRDAADDFRRCQVAYHAALGYYFEKGHTLVVLGDVEELWENQRQDVLSKYRSTLELEGAFYQDGQRYWRVWGNHDDDWRFESLVRRHLWPHFPGIEVHEGILLQATERRREVGRLLLVHGHQGSLEGGRLAGLSKYLVRFLWRPFQRRTGWNVNSPATNWGLRTVHNIALYNWAVAQEGLTLIAGHTHRPVFHDEVRIDGLRRELDAARRRGDKEKAAQVRARLEEAGVRSGNADLPADQPCYFNSGCCCYADGDITGIELDAGRIRLVRWPDNEGRPLPAILAEARLHDVLSAVAHKGPALRFPSVDSA